MSYPLVQFVSAPSRDAVVRFDCNSVGEWSDDDRWPEHDGFTLGFPSLSGDPEAVGVQYGTRSIEFNLIVRATPDVAFGTFSRLSREVQRPRNWLMVQFSDFSKPVWFYTYRTEQQALDFENVSGIDDAKRNVWGIGVRLAADPFAQGERITLPAVTTFNNPFMSEGCVIRLPAILGDAPAPVAVQIRSTINWNGYTPQLSSVALDGGPYDGAPIPFSLAGATLGTGASAAVAAATAPGGQKVPVSFATNTLVVRVTDATTVLPVGVYRVLVWVERASVADTFRLQGVRSRGGATITGDSVDFDRSASPGGSTGHATWVDLGEFSFPAFASMDDQTITYTQAASFGVAAKRLTGSGVLNMAALLYVPVDTPWAESGRLLSAAFGAPGLPTADRTAEWDEDGNYSMLVSSSLPSRSVSDAMPPKLIGGFPVVVPGCTNTVTVLQQTNPHDPADPTVDNRDNTAARTTLTFSYAPRYVHLAGSEAL